MNTDVLVFLTAFAAGAALQWGLDAIGDVARIWLAVVSTAAFAATLANVARLQAAAPYAWQSQGLTAVALAHAGATVTIWILTARRYSLNKETIR